MVAAIERAIKEKRLLEPPGSNAWAGYERLRGFGAPEAQQRAVRSALAAALKDAGEEILQSYLETREPRPSGPTDLLEGAFSAAEFERCARFFERASELLPDQGVLRARWKFCRGRALVARQMWRESKPLLREALALDPSVAYVHNALGITCLGEQRPEEAVRHFEAAVERAPQWIYARHNLALAYFTLRRYDEAERAWVLATLHAPRLAFLHVNLGVLYLQTGRRPEAQRELQHALQLDPHGPITNHNLAVLYEMDRKPAEAEAHYRKAIQADPRLLAARLNLSALYRRSGRSAAAERELRAARALQPRNPAIHEALGALLLETGRAAEAEPELLAALSAKPVSSRTLAALGDLYAGRRNFPEALDHYRQALARAADAAEREQLRRKISALPASR